MADDYRPDGWLKAAVAADGVPAWAAWQAWNEADDDDTVASIRARARELARSEG